LALTPGPSPNNWARGDWIGRIVGLIWLTQVPKREPSARKAAKRPWQLMDL